MSTMVVGVGGRGHRDWVIGPRVVARLAADQLVRSLGVRLMVTTELPSRLLDAGRDVRRLIIVRVTTEGGPLGRIHQTVLDTPTGRRPRGGSVPAASGSGFCALAGALWLPRRVVVLSVEGCDLAVGRASTPGADEVVRRVVEMVMRELGLRHRMIEPSDPHPLYPKLPMQQPQASRARSC